MAQLRKHGTAINRVPARSSRIEGQRRRRFRRNAPATPRIPVPKRIIVAGSGSSGSGTPGGDTFPWIDVTPPLVDGGTSEKRGSTSYLIAPIKKLDSKGNSSRPVLVNPLMDPLIAPLKLPALGLPAGTAGTVCVTVRINCVPPRESCAGAARFYFDLAKARKSTNWSSVNHHVVQP